MKFTPIFLLSIVTLILIISSCGKENDSPSEPPPEKDSLGTGWRRISIAGNHFMSDVVFVNNNIGFVGGDNYLGKTTDGGLTWREITTPVTEGSKAFVTLFFLNETKGWVITSSYVFRTEDGGETWQGVKTGFSNHSDIQFLNDKDGFLGASGTLAKTADGGKTWQAVATTGADFGAVFFIDKNLGWAGGRGGIFKTVNGGTTFTSQPSGSLGSHSAQFTDASNGWFAGSDISFTRNGGVSWTTIKGSSGLADIYFFDANRGYVSVGNRIYKTMDGGTTLAPLLKVPVESKLTEIFFTDENHGWATSGVSILRYEK